jgi:nitrogen fixation/metabolism regulation signal transduction histidine kinase
MSKFLSARAEKEENFRNLQTVIQHIGTGLISYNQSGDVEFINNAAKRILQLNSLKNISSLKPNHKNLYEKLLKIKAGDKNVVKINIDNDLLQLFIYATEFKMRNQDFKLIALQNIQNELEEQEMMAWQKLIKVLTHEIMNSITPISSLSATLNKMLPELKKDNKHINSELFEDISSAVTTISKRSEGLLHFVDKYRSLTKIPKPNFQVISIYSLFNRIKSLMKNEFINQNINCQFMVIPESLELTADPELIEQVLLNLIYNSMDGLTNNVEKEISISAGLSNIGKIELRVKDNGQGISDEIKEQIFVPFYSTKKNGSGIGLSLARQIMHLHGGDIRVHSIKNVETTFSLIF